MIGLLLTSIGLNGVLIHETEQRRSFTLKALPNAQAVDQPIIVAGDIETRAGGQQNAYAAEPIQLRVKPKMQVSAGMTNSALTPSSAKK